MNKENFYSDKGVYHMVRCDKCGKENHAFYVAKGKCIWCGFDKRKEDKKAKDRERWHKRYSDPELREKYLARKREYLKERRKNDADFRAKCAEYRRKYREKKLCNIKIKEAKNE